MEELRSTRIKFGVPCLNIRHKGMYVNFETDMPEDEYNDLYDSGCHWCALTQTAYGPDHQPARPDLCLAERGCCEL